MSTLPELPKQMFTGLVHTITGCYSTFQMRAYGKACAVAERARVIEECAALVQQMTAHRRMINMAVNSQKVVKECEYAAAIRALKGPT